MGDKGIEDRLRAVEGKLQEIHDRVSFSGLTDKGRRLQKAYHRLQAYAIREGAALRASRRK